MESRILRLADVPLLVDALLKTGVVVGPSMSEQLSGEVSTALYARIDSATELWLGNTRPAKSLKEFFFPQREVLFSFHRDGEGVEITEPELDATPCVVFGARPCDAAALPVLDEVFGWGERDNTYFFRRDNTTVVTVACQEPDAACFCTSVGGSPAGTRGADLMLTQLSDVYHVQVLSDKGTRLVEDYPQFFAQGTPEQDKRQARAVTELENKLSRKVDPSPIQGIAFNDPMWNELTQQCIDCGVCTFVCPTCHCFDIQDEGDGVDGQRVRLWDSCAFRDFTKMTVAQPRPEHFRRYRQRIMHKFQYYPANFGETLCVGCGRCVAACPAGVDIVDIISRLADKLAVREGE